jgi:hypothetical protein
MSRPEIDMIALALDEQPDQWRYCMDRMTDLQLKTFEMHLTEMQRTVRSRMKRKGLSRIEVLRFSRDPDEMDE